MKIIKLKSIILISVCTFSTFALISLASSGSGSGGNCWEANGTSSCEASYNNNHCQLKPAGSVKQKLQQIKSGSGWSLSTPATNDCVYICYLTNTQTPVGYQGDVLDYDTNHGGRICTNINGTTTY